MKLSIVIPVYNEEETLDQILLEVRNSPLPSQINELELVIVDDFSTDNTREKLKDIENSSTKVLYHTKNQGKGAALRTGFKNCTGDLVLIQDADLEYDPKEYNLLLEPLLTNKADVVYGSRFLSGRPHRVLYYWHSLANGILTLLSNAFSDLNLTDMETCYKVFRKSVLDKVSIEENRFGFEPEITAKVGSLSRNEGIRIYETGISYHGRTYQEGKKIGLKDAFRAFWCIFKYNDSTFARFVKYGVSGILVASSQLISLKLLFLVFSTENLVEVNVANILSIFISLILAFQLHSKFSWRYNFESLSHLITSFGKFMGVSLISFVSRTVLFYFLNLIGIDPYLNAILGIVLAVMLNFFGYNRFVFSDDEK